MIQALFHAAALTGRSLDDVLRWVANPANAGEPAEILLQHPHAAPYWLGLLHGALHGDDRTAGNTITTVQQAMGLFFQEQIRRRCMPSPGRPASDVADVIRRGGTVYLLGREDPYASASPLMTAVAEHVLDTALGLANTSPWRRLCPPLLACLDELPSTAPLPTLQIRMANEQSKDGAFNQEISDLVGQVRVARRSWQTGAMAGSTFSGDSIAILRPEEIRRLKERHALVLAENGKPIIARMARCIDGKAGRGILADQRQLRTWLAERRVGLPTAEDRATAAVAEARNRGIVTDQDSYL